MVTLPSLESNVTFYCQNKCASCNHMIPLVEHPYHVDPAVIERDLKAMSKIAHSLEYSIVGGEPTLHPQIVDIIRIIKRSGIANLILMYTNGQAMKHLPDAFFEELDLLRVDPYKIDEEQKDYIKRRCLKAGLPIEWHSTQFMRQFYRNKHTPEKAAKLFKHCWFRYNRSVVDEGYFYRCCTSPFIPQYLLGQERTADAIPVEGLTEEKLIAYLNPPETPDICYVCSGNFGEPVGWHETTREKWLEESLG
jgi:cyclic pyranopterin phosphate synthase